MKIRKILAAFVSVVTICSVISVPTFAAQETQIVTDLVSPAYEYAMSTVLFKRMLNCDLSNASHSIAHTFAFSG